MLIRHSDKFYSLHPKNVSSWSKHLLEPVCNVHTLCNLEPFEITLAFLPVHTGLLERKKRSACAYKKSYFVPTHAGQNSLQLTNPRMYPQSTLHYQCTNIIGLMQDIRV